MAKLNLKSVYTNESTYTVLQLLYKMCDTLDTWELNNIEFVDYKPSSDYITYKLITYPDKKVAVDYAKLAGDSFHAGTAGHADLATQADTAGKSDLATALEPEKEFQCRWYHNELTGDKAPVIGHPESELWIYLKDDSTTDTDPVRYWSFVIKIGNLTKYLSKDIASGPNQGKTGVIFRDTFQNLIIEAIKSVVPTEFANAGILVRATAPTVADTMLLRPTLINELDATVPQIKPIALVDSFLNYANGGWSIQGDNNYVTPNTLIITGSAWCDNK